MAGACAILVSPVPRGLGRRRARCGVGPHAGRPHPCLAQWRLSCNLWQISVLVSGKRRRPNRGRVRGHAGSHRHRLPHGDHRNRYQCQLDVQLDRQLVERNQQLVGLDGVAGFARIPGFWRIPLQVGASGRVPGSGRFCFLWNRRCDTINAGSFRFCLALPACETDRMPARRSDKPCSEFLAANQFGRRQILQAGGAGHDGTGLARIVEPRGCRRLGCSGPRLRQGEACIFLFMWGGPSQLDTFDLKPEPRRDPRAVQADRDQSAGRADLRALSASRPG